MKQTMSQKSSTFDWAKPLILMGVAAAGVSFFSEPDLGVADRAIHPAGVEELNDDFKFIDCDLSHDSPVTAETHDVYIRTTCSELLIVQVENVYLFGSDTGDYSNARCANY